MLPIENDEISGIKSAELDVSIPDGTVSNAQVMKSAAGFYVGTSIYRDEMWVPCERYSDYMKTSSAAQGWLDRSVATGGL
jgi:hypothetical protein